jgi:hypothetical protein
VLLYLEDILMKVTCKFGGADLRENAEGQADDIVVISIEIDSDPVGGHHEKL